MKNQLFLILIAAILIPRVVQAQTSTEWQDSLADQMVGTWRVEGQVMGRPAHHDIQADWVLRHQFLRIHEKTSANAPTTERPYEAMWFLGYDTISEKYVLHLVDIFGGRFSEVLGYGTREGNELRFVFEYPDGPFHTTFHWNPDRRAGNGEWHRKMQAANGFHLPT